MMNYKPIIEKIIYWINYEGEGDEYRKTHDLDCILTGGNLLADTIISLWLPLRYTLNYFDHPRWIYWKEYESVALKPQKMGLKDHREFLIELMNNIEVFLPQNERTEKLIQLFKLGQERANVMILPIRSWNSKRGTAPYYDYLPHFLYDQMSADKTGMVAEWIKREKLTMFFKGEANIKEENLRDLAGTGDIRCHAPKNIDLIVLLDNYINVLESRENALKPSLCNTEESDLDNSMREILEKTYKKSLNDEGIDFDEYCKKRNEYWEGILPHEECDNSNENC